MKNLRALLGAAACLVLAGTGLATAQDYPTRPVRLIIPFPPGGSNDVVGRLIAIKLGDRLGKQVVVDNRGGAGGVIGTEAVAKSPPDGYTLLIISMAHAVNPWLYKLNYDPIKDFAPVGLLAKGANVLVVHPSLPVHSVADLIALAKKQPGDLQYASAGIGSFQHLGGELFKLMAGVDMLHVPFKGGGPALVDVVGGHTKVMFSSMVQTVPHIHSGKLRALGTGGLAAQPGAARCSHHRRSRRPQLRGGQLVGHGGAGRHAAGDHRQAEHGALGGAERARGAEAVRARRRRAGADEAGRVRRLHGQRNEQVGEGRQAGRHQGGMMRCRSAVTPTSAA